MGYDAESKKLDAETLQKYIYGGNVSEYMEWLQEENGDKYHTHFKKALAEDLDADSIEDMYKEVRRHSMFSNCKSSFQSECHQE